MKENIKHSSQSHINSFCWFNLKDLRTTKNHYFIIDKLCIQGHINVVVGVIVVYLMKS